MNTSLPAPPPARPRATSAVVRVGAALAAVVVAAVWGTSAGSGGTVPSAAAAQTSLAAPRAPRSGVASADHGIVRVTAHCSMTAANALVPADGTTPPAAGGPGSARLAPQGGSIPPGFEPVAVISCGLADAAGPDGAVHRSAVERRATADLESLFIAYQSPLPSFAAGGGCTAQLDTDPVIAFVDAKGEAIWPSAPRDSCNHVTPQVRGALAKIAWTVAASRAV